MSADYYLFRCTGCDFTDLHSTGVTYNYQGQPEKEPVIGIGWCEDCDAIVNTVGPYRDDEAESSLYELELALNDLEASSNQAIAFSAQEHKKEIEKKISDVRIRLSYFQNHPYSLRCIVCNGHQVTPFYLPFPDLDKSERINIQHSCGGELIVNHKGSIPLQNHLEVTINEEGRILSSEIKSTK